MDIDKEPRSKFIAIKAGKSKDVLVLGGAWTVDNAGAITQAIEQAKKETDGRPFDIAGEEIERLDTTGALLLKTFLAEPQAARLADEHRALLDFLPPVSEYKPQQERRPPVFTAFCRRVGEMTFIG